MMTIEKRVNRLQKQMERGGAKNDEFDNRTRNNSADKGDSLLSRTKDVNVKVRDTVMSYETQKHLENLEKWKTEFVGEMDAVYSRKYESLNAVISYLNENIKNQ